MFTSIPSNPNPLIGDSVYFKDGYEVTLFQGRLFLYKNHYRMAELINGYETLDKKFKGDMDKWIKFVIAKDIDKISNIEFKIEELKKEIEHLKSIHGIE